MSDSGRRGSGITLMGLVLGFAAGALTVLLSDPNNRKKVKEKTDEMLDQGISKSSTTIEKVAEKAKEAVDKLQETVHTTADKTVKKVKGEIDKTEEDLKNEG